MDEAHKPNWVERLLGRPGLWLAFTWGLAEGTLFFIVPDVIVTLAAMFRPRRALLHASAAVGGALLAGALMYGWASAAPASARAAVDTVPFVSTEMFATVQQDFEAEGLWAVFKGPRLGIPYKVYAVQAPGRLPLATFLLATAPARFERFILTWAGFAVLGLLMKRVIQARPRALAGVHAVLWTAFYAYYWAVT